VSVVALFLGLYGLTGIAWGRDWLRASFFPFFLLGFCVPLGSLTETVTFPLRVLVCRLVEWISHYILAIDVIRQGTALSDPTGKYQYEVAVACSGMRSLISTIAMGCIFAFVFAIGNWWKRIFLISAAIPLAVLGNLLRMLLIVVVSEIWGQDAGNWVHDGGYFGEFSLLPYVPGFLGLLFLADWYEKSEKRKHTGGGSGSAPKQSAIPQPILTDAKGSA
jgi:exosortase